MILAIESAISGGSIAILDDGSVIASFTGQTGVSRAEDLLPNLDALLRANNISKNDIDRVAISVGPGSFTGLRIGISTVLGLKASLGVECVGVELFSAIQTIDPDASVAVPLGKSDICFRKKANNEVVAVPVAELPAHMIRVEKIIAHHDIVERLTEAGAASVYDIGRDLAIHIGRYAIGEPASDHLEPIYIQSPRFV
jgi:tRNA threonylcarbamoyl adenosine modification protein YeaZ